MNEIVQHIPAFVEIEGERERMGFETVDDLLAIPWIRKWREFPGFYRFSLSNHDGLQPLLMAEFRGGEEWWVVGFLKEPIEGLPEWKHP